MKTRLSAVMQVRRQRAEAWAAIVAIVSFVGAWCIGVYGFNMTRSPIGYAVGIAIYNAVKLLWLAGRG